MLMAIYCFIQMAYGYGIATHDLMPNGFGLGGDPSSTQSGVIVPLPNDPNTYYVFTVDYQGRQLRYSIVDLTKENGFGDVISKNSLLLNRSTEKITAVLHANGRDIWVLGHEFNSDEFYAWLVTDLGVQAPVVSAVGSYHGGAGRNAIGYMKLSNDGKNLAIASSYSPAFLELFSFNNTNGVVSDPIKIDDFESLSRGPYGLEFSPNGRYLYVSEVDGDLNKLYQIGLPTVGGSIKTAGKEISSGIGFGALQLAPNGKIYMATYDQTSLDIIHSPDSAWAAINYEKAGIQLSGRKSTIGLPTFIQSFFRQVEFEASHLCAYDLTEFTINAAQFDEIDSVIWNFGDPESGQLNVSRLVNPTHVFSKSDTFSVTLRAYFEDQPVVVSRDVIIKPIPESNFNNNALLINGESLNLTVAANLTADWQDGSTELNRMVSSPGWYWVDITNQDQCTLRDSIALFNLSYADTCFTSPTSFALEAGNISLDSVRWGFGDPNSGIENSSTLTTPSHTFSAPGDFEVNLKIFYEDEEVNKSFNINIPELPDAGLPEALALVNDATQSLNTGSLSTSWDNGSTDKARTLRGAGWHWADLLNEAGCTHRDSVAVFTLSYADTCHTSQTRLWLEAGNITVDSVRWNLGDASGGVDNFQSGAVIDHEFSAPGNYTVNANIYYNGRTFSTDFDLNIAALPQLDLGQERTLFYGETERLSVTGTGTSYLWQDGSTQDNLLVQGPGLYWVEVTNQAGCSARDSVQINYDQIIDVRLPDDIQLCPGDELPLDMALPGATYLWQDGSTEANYTVNSPGTYWVEITNAFQNRVFRDSMTVEYYAFGELDIISQHIICETQSLELVATGAKEGESYRWYDEGGTLLAENTGTFTTPELSADTRYFVSMTNGTCETEPVGISIINDMVTARIAPIDSIVGMGEPVYLNGSGGEYYQWTPATWLDQPDQPSVVAYPDNDIEYKLTVTGAWGCTDSTSVRIYVERAIYPPDAFSPNGDGHNDTWEIKNLDRFPNNRVEIYNRLGKLVAAFDNYEGQWDGTIDGSYLLGYTFHYIIYYDHPVRTEHGVVRILR